MTSTLTYPTDDCVVIHDNVECIRLLTAQGLLNVITRPEPPYTKCHAHFHTATHWGQGIYFSGYREESDNGFLITLLPRSGFTEAQARAWFALALVELSGGEIALVTANTDPLRN